MNRESMDEQPSPSQPKDAVINVRVTPDGMQAYMRISAPSEGGSEPEFPDAMRILKDAGVIYGVDENAVREALLFRQYDADVHVANGTPPMEGQDGSIAYSFDPKFKVIPREDDKGNVDFRNLGLIRSVNEGAKIAELIPPKPGVPGKTVTGTEIPPKEGKPAVIPAGKNTMPHPENPAILVAAASGALIYRSKNVIDIEPVYTIQGDIDFSTGNIDYVGSLQVQGDLKSGFKIKAGGDVDIAGVVEDAEIEAEGQVVLQKGIVGRGKGIVKAGGNVYLNFCEGQRVVSKGDIYVGEALLHSTLIAGGKIIVNNKKGAIIGGHVFATRGVEVRNLGNYQHARTEVTVGINEETQRRLEELEENVRKNEENIGNVKKAIQVLAVQKATGKLPPDKRILLDKLRTAVGALETQKNEMQKQKEILEREFEQYKDATIEVYQKIYPGVHLRIQRAKIAINEERSRICYFLDSAVINMKPL